jgi:hypothetical protein
MHTILFIAGFVIALNTSQPGYVKRIATPAQAQTDYGYMIPRGGKSIKIPGAVK